MSIYAQAIDGLGTTFWGKWKKGRKPVIQIDMEGNEIRKFNSVVDASIAMGGTVKSRIRQVCQGKFETCMGYKWKYDTNTPKRPIQ